MTIEEARSAFADLRENGLTDEEIAMALYNINRENKLDLEQFDSLARLLGFSLTEEFIKEERVN